MLFSIAKIAVALSVVGLAHAAPAIAPIEQAMSKRNFDCSNPVYGLTTNDCNHMSSIGMYGQGVNAQGNNGLIWIGNDGPNTFEFTNNGEGGAPVTLIIWNNPAGDYSSSFMNVRIPQISYSLANGESITISMANGVSGGWAGLYNEESNLTQYGQINNWWGEFTTGDYATFDITREVNMGGNPMVIEVDGCTADINRCVFQCYSGNTCGDSQTYELVGCGEGSQPGATYGVYGGNPSGGCQGWSNGGSLSISFQG